MALAVLDATGTEAGPNHRLELSAGTNPVKP